MSGVKFNSGFYKKMDAIVTMTSSKGLADLAKKTARWGIKNQGDLPMIMGILEFGDPAHTFPNAKRGAEKRKAVEDLIASGGENPSAIPPRPWLRKSTQGTYRSHLTKYINENLPKVLRGIPKSGQSITSTKAELSTQDFIQGLAETGRDNARASWGTANFVPNSPATLANKADSRPLHDTGRMNESVITAWSE